MARGGWLTSHDSIFTPNLGGMIQFDGRAYFSNGLVKNHHLGDGVVILYIMRR